MLPILATEDINSIVTEEVRLLTLEEIEITKQYFKPTDSYKCSSQIEILQKELAKGKEHVTALTSEIKRLTFSEECLVDDDFAKIHTGLPNVKVVKVAFEHVSKTLPLDGVTKLSPFQEFMCVSHKLRMNNLIEYLAYCFGISPSTVLNCLKQMDITLNNLILRPNCYALRKTMPACFQASFGKKLPL